MPCRSSLCQRPPLASPLPSLQVCKLISNAPSRRPKFDCWSPSRENWGAIAIMQSAFPLSRCLLQLSLHDLSFLPHRAHPLGGCAVHIEECKANQRALFRLGCPSILSKTITLRCYETLSFYLHLVEYIRHFHVRWQTRAVESAALLFLVAQNFVSLLCQLSGTSTCSRSLSPAADYVIPTFLSALYAHHGVHRFPPAVGPPRSAQPRAPRHRQIHIHGGKIGLFGGAGVGTERTEQS